MKLSFTYSKIKIADLAQPRKSWISHHSLWFSRISLNGCFMGCSFSLINPLTTVMPFGIISFWRGWGLGTRLTHKVSTQWIDGSDSSSMNSSLFRNKRGVLVCLSPWASMAICMITSLTYCLVHRHPLYLYYPKTEFIWPWIKATSTLDRVNCV